MSTKLAQPNKQTRSRNVMSQKNIAIVTGFTQEDEVKTYTVNRKVRDIWCWIANPILIILMIILFCVSQYTIDFSKIKFVVSRPDFLGRFCTLEGQPDPEQPSFNRLFVGNIEETFCRAVFPADKNVICANFDSKLINKFNFRKAYSDLIQAQMSAKQVSLQTANRTFCINQKTDCILPKDVDYTKICSQDFMLITKRFLASDANTTENNADHYLEAVTAANSQEASANPQFYTNDVFQAMVRYSRQKFRYLELFCDTMPRQSTGDVNEQLYTNSSIFGLLQCDLDQTKTFTQKFSFINQLPAYVSYVFNYFANWRSQFLIELSSDYSIIIIGVICAFFASYVYMIAGIMLTKVLIVFTRLIIPAGLIILSIYLFTILKEKFIADSVQFHMFGFENYTVYLIGVIVLLVGIILIIGALVLIMNVMLNVENIKKSGNCIQVCKATLQKRLRLFAIPLLFCTFLIILSVVNVFMFLSILLGGTVKAGVGVVFQTLDPSTLEYSNQGSSIAASVFIWVYFIVSIAFLRNSQMYIISVLTVLWYNDRITHKFRNQRNIFVKSHKDANTMRFRRALIGAKKILIEQTVIAANNGSTAKLTLNADYFNMGSGDSYSTASKLYFKNFGSIIFFSIVSILIFVPRLFFLPFSYISNTDMFSALFSASDSSSRAVGWINDMVMMTDKNLLYFMSITGFSYIDCIKKFKEVVRVNQVIIRDIKRGTFGVVLIGQILMGCLAFIIAEALNLKQQPQLAWSFRLTRVLVCFIGGFIASGYVFQLINVINMSMIYIYNLDVIRGHTQNKVLMPRALLNLINSYGLGDKYLQIMRKVTIRCVELIDKLVKNETLEEPQDNQGLQF